MADVVGVDRQDGVGGRLIFPIRLVVFAGGQREAECSGSVRLLLLEALGGEF